MNNKITIFYRKSTGDLANICTDEQTMAFYGALQANYELIHFFI